MKRLYPVVIVLFVLGLIIPAQAQMANTIDELVKMFDDSKCKECHPQQYSEWEKSWHSKSVVSSLKGMSNFFSIGVPKEWERKLTKKEVMKCLDCHAPTMKYASEELAVEVANMIVKAFTTKDEKEKKALKKELSKLNVGCLGCHNVKATTISLGLLGEPERDTIYTSREVFSPAHKTIPVNTMDKSLFCAQCHGIYYAPDGEAIYCNTLNGSYYDNYRARGGLETCQDCHMKKKNRGHTFPGGHDLEIVKEGIDFNAEIYGIRHSVGKWIPRAIVNVSLENKAGHRIPDG